MIYKHNLLMGGDNEIFCVVDCIQEKHRDGVFLKICETHNSLSKDSSSNQNPLKSHNLDVI